MLRIEKESGNKLARIGINNRFSFWTANFLFSFSLALGLHLLGALIFCIKPLRVNYADQIFSPVKVAVDSSQPDSLVALDFEGNSFFLSPFQELEDPIPEYPDRARVELDKFIVFRKDRKKDSPVKLLPAKDDYSNFLDPLPSLKKGKRRLELQISGELADLKFKNNVEADKNILRELENTQMKATFAVLVEGKSGTVFWKENREPLGDKKLQALADRIVDSLEFEPQEGDFVKSGIVEVRFRAS